MPLKNDRFSSSSYSSFSYSSSSSSSQLTTPRACQNLLSPRLSPPQPIATSPLWDVEKTKCGNSCWMPKSKEELRREIIELDTKILQLEQYLLSLYRTSFGDFLPELFLDDSLSCHKTPPLKPFTAKFRNDCVSSFSDKDKKKGSESGNPSLADLLGLNLNTPNKLYED